jgi:hypothetical protein
MLRILSDGENRHRLEDATGTSIGWIRGRYIGFRGFESEANARDAAKAAWRAMQAGLRQQYPGWPAYEADLGRLRTMHDGIYEWFYDGTERIARVLRPHSRAYDTSLGIELVLPSYASEGVAMTIAQAMGRAVRPYEAATAGPGAA